MKNSPNNFASQVVEFNEIANGPSAFNVRKVGLYIGLILEEIEEVLAAIKAEEGTPIDISLDKLKFHLRTNSDAFKAGYFDPAILNIDKVEALDGFVDTAVVALGGAYALGADVVGAANEVMESNLSKFPIQEDGTRLVLKDENGKVKKPDTFWKPELKQFIL